MCGICGKFIFDSSSRVNPEVLQGMTDVLYHRGPDDGGVHVENRQDYSIGLGHRRLSIIDLSEAGHQPMCNEDGTVWVVFNGEIYNFMELRGELERIGHVFKSKTDSEVLIHLYEEYGSQCVKRLRGMFAFAIWDSRKNRLLLARDRVGQKPLVYVRLKNSIIFASEIKSILKDPDVRKEVDLSSLHDYLTFQYVPAPKTMFKGIMKLPPAHIMKIENGKVDLERYWKLDYNRKFSGTSSGMEDRLTYILKEAVRMRMVSDVPLGVFLSGGIDSSIVVAMMARAEGSKVRTFSIGFDDASFSELKFAKKVASVFDTEHHEYMIKPNAIEVLPKLVWHFDEPFGDSSAIPTYYLSKATRQEVTVALNGDGGDESFAGYDRYFANALGNRYHSLPLSVRNALYKNIVSRLPESTDKKDFFRRLKKFTNPESSTGEQRYANWMSIFDNNQKTEVYSQEMKALLAAVNSQDYLLDAYREVEAANFLDSTMGVDVQTYLPNDLLVKADISSMANSLEARSPFLDHILMEFAASIPSNMKLKGKVSKYILKKTMKTVLPKEILSREKMGFGVPIGAWFKSELKDYVRDLLLDYKSLNRGYFKREALEKIVEEHINGTVDHSHRIWLLLNLELWHRTFIDKSTEQILERTTSDCLNGGV